ncbi:12819_t:CDS:2 [Entrophospora sp. SA101]|nr:12819_t:CDS:2 [Entrophospora sp. SA101]
MLKKLSITSRVQFVIDEAHCVLEHQYFRNAWNGVAETLKRDFPNSSIMMVSATMSEKDAHILCEKMKIEWNDLTIIRSSSFARPHNFLQVQEKKKSKKDASYGQVVEEINKNPAGRCIVYCASPKICEDLKIYIINEITNCEVGLYHGNLSGKEKHVSLMKWKTGNTKIIIATNAFGMGINTSDLSNRQVSKMPVSNF